MSLAQPLWANTPLLHSKHLSNLLASNVYLKLDVGHCQFFRAVHPDAFPETDREF